MDEKIEDLKQLNFRISHELHHKFKLWCLMNRTDMNSVIEELITKKVKQ